MSGFKALLALLVAAVATLLPANAHAVTCTINGSVTLDSADSYYCDEDILGTSACSSWREKNLDSTTKPIQYMHLCVLKDNVELDCAQTDANGNWSATFSLTGSSCQGQEVEIRHFYIRVHENDVGVDFPRLRFWVTHLDANGVPDLPVWFKSDFPELDGFVTSHSRHWARGSLATSTRLANIYFTANSYLKE